MRVTEFAHIHPVDDGSFHLIVPEKVRSGLIKAGWAEPHPRKNHIIMLYAPRDKAELGVVMNVLSISYQFSLKKRNVNTFQPYTIHNTVLTMFTHSKHNKGPSFYHGPGGAQTSYRIAPLV